MALKHFNKRKIIGFGAMQEKLLDTFIVILLDVSHTHILKLYRKIFSDFHQFLIIFKLVYILFGGNPIKFTNFFNELIKIKMNTNKSSFQ